MCYLVEPSIVGCSLALVIHQPRPSNPIGRLDHIERPDPVERLTNYLTL